MLDSDPFAPLEPRPVCVGSGLVALDVVISSHPQISPKFWAGGSCGNVLTILAYLGWESYPVAALREGPQAEALVSDLRQWGVDTSLICLSSSGSTPIIVEKILTDRNGLAWHRFEWTCPRCGSWLPRYRPLSARLAAEANEKAPEAHVFYFDRPSTGALELAKQSKEQGAVVVFEPPSARHGALFRECLEVADVLKYSHERLEDAGDQLERFRGVLEIETLGPQGLRFRRGSKRRSRWRTQDASPVDELRDAAGAGDWCTAGVIYALCREGRAGLDDATDETVWSGLSFGQALASMNCRYEGARGSMYSIPREDFEALVKGIWNSGDTTPQSVDADSWLEELLTHVECICPKCTAPGRRKATAPARRARKP